MKDDDLKNIVTSCATVPDAVEVFQSEKKDNEIEHCIITILCTLKSNEARKKYLSLTRKFVLPVKSQHPSCVRVTQTIPQNTDKIQVLWIQEWQNLIDFKGVMKELFKEGSPINEVNDLLVCNPEATFARFVMNKDITQESK